MLRMRSTSETLELAVRLGKAFVDAKIPLWRLVASKNENWLASISGSVKI